MTASGPYAAVLLTRSGKCLVHCAVGAYAQNPSLRASTLATMLVTLQDVGGHPASSYAEISGVGVVLLEGYRVVIAVLCNP